MMKRESIILKDQSGAALVIALIMIIVMTLIVPCRILYLQL